MERLAKTVAGTQIQFNISLVLPGGLTMDEVEFTCMFFVYPNRVKTYAKESMERIDENNYGVGMDTAGLGKGPLLCQIDVLMPDGRMEKVLCGTNETIAGGI